ncbi:MAG: hypothetical protein JWR15_4194 [Prosthecobacter sp.]|nr:hypothetical protein [Prosthecobacter sp.]
MLCDTRPAFLTLIANMQPRVASHPRHCSASILEMLENIAMQLVSKVSLVCMVERKERLFDGVINGLVEIVFALSIPNPLNKLVPPLNGRRVRMWKMDSQCLLRTGRKRWKPHGTQCVWHQVRQATLIPVKPGDHSAIAHGPEESFDAKNIANPTRDVVRVPGVEDIVCGVID